jgi:hypothetical protein
VVGGSARWKRSEVRAGTRCKSLETSAQSKPPRWESNHGGGTSGSGGTDSPKEGQPSGSGCAPGKSVQTPSERTRGGGSVAAGVLAGTRDISVQPTDGGAAMRSGPPADSPGVGATRQRPSRDARWHASAIATQVSPPVRGGFRRWGGVCEHGPSQEEWRRSGWYLGASGERAPAGDRDVRDHRVIEPGWKGPEQAEKLKRAVARERRIQNPLPSARDGPVRESPEILGIACVE